MLAIFLYSGRKQRHEERHFNVSFREQRLLPVPIKLTLTRASAAKCAPSSQRKEEEHVMSSQSSFKLFLRRVWLCCGAMMGQHAENLMYRSAYFCLIKWMLG